MNSLTWRLTCSPLCFGGQCHKSWCFYCNVWQSLPACEGAGKVSSVCVCVCVSANPHQGGNKLRNAVKAYLVKHYLIGVLSHRTRLGCEWYSVLSLSLATHCFLPIIYSLAPLPILLLQSHSNQLPVLPYRWHIQLSNQKLNYQWSLAWSSSSSGAKNNKAQQPKLAPRSKWFVYTTAGHHPYLVNNSLGM